MKKKIDFYLNLALNDRKALRYQLWMVWNRYTINSSIWLFSKISKSQNKFLTIHNRPMLANAVGTWSDPLLAIPTIALVLQGPLVLDNNFTLETIRLYKKHFTQSMIIVSTWEGENADYLTKIKAEGVELILNAKPAIVGIGNLNLQIVSSYNGIMRAKERGAAYVYKTRCDQRMYGVNINEFLHNLITQFPLKKPSLLKQRIIASSFSTLKYVPYLITDMFLFGHIDDMLLYWSAKHDNRLGLEKMIRTVQDLNDAKVSESYLCSEFLKAVGREVTWTIEDSWAAYADHFCIVDRQSLDLFWYKYNSYQEYSATRYDGITNSQLLTFAEWFNLYSNSPNKVPVPEDILTLSRMDIIKPTA